jgi:hypothetical protein
MIKLNKTEIDLDELGQTFQKAYSSFVGDNLDWDELPKFRREGIAAGCSAIIDAVRDYYIGTDATDPN